MRVLAALLMLAFAPCAYTCTTHECSDDVLGVIGNEWLEWDAAADPEGEPVHYEIWRNAPGETGPCVVTADTHVLVAGTPCVAPPVTVYLHVRACDPAGNCGGWSGDVEFLPFACLCASGEHACYEDAARRLPHLPECS